MAHLLIGSDAFEVEVSGKATKPALVLSSSLGTDLSMWDGQMPLLTKHFRVIRYDTRGHGGSELGDTPVSLARLGADVIAILDALEIEKAHWLGLSMGGAIGLWLLVNAPTRIERAVLANTAPRLGTPENWNARILLVLKRGMKENAAATIERWFSPGFAERHPETVERIHEMLRKTTPEGYAACCAALRDMDLRDALDDIDHEVLVISGTDDPVVPKAESESLVRAIAGARHIKLQARHMSNIEAEAAFNAAVVQFLTAERRASRPRPKVAAKTRPTSPAPAASKRTGAARRSNPARRPLKAAAKKTPSARAAKPTKKAASARRRPTKVTRRPATAPTTRKATKTAASKAPAKKAVRKSASKASTARRPTPIAAARVTSKRPKVAAKSASKSTAKGSAKKSAKKTTSAKKMPAARRVATKKPRRPTGRRKR